jgi:hypothetical protein
MFTTPGWTQAWRSTTSISRILLRRAVAITRLPTATTPPESPVPAPRGTNGTPCVEQSWTMRETSSVVSGKATARGTARSKVCASHS